MTWKSYAAVSGATVLAGWLASSPPSNTPGSTAGSATRSPRRPSPAATDIEQQAARLQSRLRSVREYARAAARPVSIRRPSSACRPRRACLRSGNTDRARGASADRASYHRLRDRGRAGGWPGPAHGRFELADGRVARSRRRGRARLLPRLANRSRSRRVRRAR